MLEINGDKYQAIHFFVSDFGDTEIPAGYTNTMTFSAGLHTSANDDRIGGGMS